MCDKIYMRTWKSEEGKRQTKPDGVVFYLTKGGNNSACGVSVSHSLKCWTILWGIHKSVHECCVVFERRARTGRLFSEFPLDVLAH